MALTPDQFYANIEKEELFTVGDLLNRWSDELQLRLLTNQAGLKKKITNSDLDRPGLALTGYIERFAYRRIQILGQTEMSYIYSLDPDAQKQAFYNILRFPAVPCIIICKNQPVPRQILEIANSFGTAIIQSARSTTELRDLLKEYLLYVFAEQTVIHGSMVEVYGVGMLIIGEPGIGKSECVLDLVERGHRFVADDVVLVKRIRPHTVTAYSNSRLRHYMEIRGLGIVNIKDLFGIWAVRPQKDVDIIVKLLGWDVIKELDRSGLECRTETILDVIIPLVTIPVTPGKNMTVISEVIAMNFLREKIEGVSSGAEFYENLARNLEERRII